MSGKSLKPRLIVEAVAGREKKEPICCYQGYVTEVFSVDNVFILDDGSGAVRVKLESVLSLSKGDYIYVIARWNKKARILDGRFCYVIDNPNLESLFYAQLCMRR
mmetsp:Transcript_22781/g.58025  ORF Transcript_22781/g.58025 Transcript_22781/m.58025 type:complete len:105 (-) Transcript_22781:517-831(-)